MAGPQPRSAQDMYVMPLVQGVMLDADPLLLPKGALQDSRNISVDDRGVLVWPAGEFVERDEGSESSVRDGLRRALGREAYVTDWHVLGAPDWILGSTHPVYWNGTKWIVAGWVRASHTIESVASHDADEYNLTITGHGAANGDLMEAETAGGVQLLYIVTDATGANVVRVRALDPLTGAKGPEPTGTANFLPPESPIGTRTAVYNGKIYVASGNTATGLLSASVDGSILSEVDPTPETPANVVLDTVNNVLAFNDRIWVGNFREDDGGMTPYTSRIRWTTKTDLTEFPVAQWVDIRSEGIDEIAGMYALGDIMLVFGANLRAVRGNLSSIQGLPVIFRKFDLPTCGPSSPYAVAYAKNGLFTANRTGLYYFGRDGRVERFTPSFMEQVLGTEVTQANGRTLTSLSYVDELDGLLLAVGGATTYTTLWFFSFISKSWAYVGGVRERTDDTAHGPLVLGEPIAGSVYAGLVASTRDTWENWLTLKPDAYVAPSAPLTDLPCTLRTGALMFGGPEARETYVAVEVIFDRVVNLPSATLTLTDALDTSRTWTWTGAITDEVTFRRAMVFTARAVDITFSCGANVSSLFRVTGFRLRGRAHGRSDAAEA